MSKKLTSIRISDPVEELLEKLKTKRQTTRANIIEEAIRLLAKKEKISETIK